MESVSECSSKVQEMRSPFVSLVSLAFVAVHCSGRFCMRVLMCVFVLLSSLARCAYVAWVYGVVAGFFGSGCDDGVGF